jgi:hypothetical protein
MATVIRGIRRPGVSDPGRKEYDEFCGRRDVGRRTLKPGARARVRGGEIELVGLEAVGGAFRARLLLRRRIGPAEELVLGPEPRVVGSGYFSLALGPGTTGEAAEIFVG